MLTCDVAALGRIALIVGMVTAVASGAEGQAYIGALTGVATLSADARAVIADDEAHVSLYTPQNGPALNLFAGWHLHDYITLQANYIWNRNDLTLVSVVETAGRFFEQRRDSTQHAFVGDLLVYFRSRPSRLRPYLSAGLGVVRLQSRQTGAAVNGRLALPPERITSTRAALRVAVGLDVGLAGGLSLRYSFSETVSGNPISERLTPTGTRGLANFQNLVGVLWTF